MARQIFLNLPVTDLASSFRFYTALGFSNNPRFSDDTAQCMVWSDSIYVMLLSLPKFGHFATKPIADTHAALAGLYSLSLDSTAEMNERMEAGLNAGGTEPNPLRDYGFMQQRTIEDPDGHTWELFYMDMSKMPGESNA